MKNWAGNITWNPSEIEIQQLVLKATNSNKKTRTIGTGHSFTALNETDNILISLDKHQGKVSVNKEKNQGNVKGETKLR